MESDSTVFTESWATHRSAWTTNTLDADKLFRAVIMGILVLESSGSNGSEVSAVLATQVNRHDHARVKSGQNEQWPNHRRFLSDRDVNQSYAHYGDAWSCQRPGNNDELGDWEYSEEDQKDESARGSGQNMTARAHER